MASFFKESYYEIKRVQWPSKRETIRLTVYVIGASLGVGLFVSGFDFLFKEVLTKILTK